jgi:hypothetical protein
VFGDAAGVNWTSRNLPFVGVGLLCTPASDFPAANVRNMDVSRSTEVPLYGDLCRCQQHWGCNLIKPQFFTTIVVIYRGFTCPSAQALPFELIRLFTIAGQIEFWARVGRAALDNPDLPVTFVAESLASMAEPREQATPFIPRSRQG